MSKEWIKYPLVLLAAALLLLVTFGDSRAEWHALLDEHFMPEEWDNPLAAPPWPWWIVIGRIQWHWNPYPPHNLASGANRSWNSWGLQDYIYNRNVTPHEWQHMALWCARTNGVDVAHPLWPADTTYTPDQNAWAWVGPFDLTRAVSAGVSFWAYVDLERFSFDSLTVGATNDDALMTLDDNDFRENCPVGMIINSNTQDWQYRKFYFDSLMLGDDTINLLGERRVWLYFAWHTDSLDQAGMGAFIDDINVAWDDGLFDIRPERKFFGYPVEEDSIDWADMQPQEDDSIYFRLDWKCVGSEGEVPEFGINLLIDDTLFYSERRSIVVDPEVDSVFTTQTDTLWCVPSGTHYYMWILDVDEEVEESSEDNNIVMDSIYVEWNPAPEFVISTPETLMTPVAVTTDDYPIHYFISDSNDFSFRVIMFATEDTTGIADSILDYLAIGANYNARLGEAVIPWDVKESYQAGLIDTGRVYYICGICHDGVNTTVAVAPGTVWIRPIEDAAPGESLPPLEYGLTRAYPNPFNRSVNLEYGLAAPERVRLAVYDLGGRQVALLTDGIEAAGRHTVKWTPQHMPGGLYTARLDAAGRVFMRKVVYLP